MSTLTLTDKDLLMFETLWRWKYLSTAALSAKFFGNKKPITAYCGLRKLKRHGFIYHEERFRGYRKTIWKLTKKGINAIRDRLPDRLDQIEDPHRIDHDVLCTALHLGEWLVNQPSCADVFTKRQLETLTPHQFPDWVPKTDHHSPDGYWRVPSPGRMVTIAFEVELTFNGSRRYGCMAGFYEERPEIHRVVWLVPAELKEYLTATIEGVTPDNAKKHLLVDHDDFLENGWQAKLHYGREEGQTLFSLLNSDGKTSIKLPQQCSSNCWTSFILDFRSSPFNSKGLHTQGREGRFSD